MSSQTRTHHDAGLREPDEFDEGFEESTLLAPPVDPIHRPRSERLHRRSGTGTNMSTNSVSTKRTALGMGRRALGLLLMLVTISMWTTSNFLASSIFADDTYSKPYFVTWVNVGMFSLFLIGPLTRRVLSRTRLLPFWTRQGGSGPLYSQLGGNSQQPQAKPADQEEDAERGSSLQSSRASLILDESMVMSSAGFEPSPSETDRLSLSQTARLSLEFCILWFAANYFVSACLQYTSVASSTVLGSTSSVFTLGFGACLGAERFTIRKLISVAVCLLGVVLISQVDLSGSSDDNRGSFPEKSNAEMAIGDALALAGAIGYGLYTIVLKKRVGDESRLDVFVFFGFIGMWDLLLLWPGMLILHWTGTETFEAPPGAGVWWVIVANGLISVVSDVSWTYSMLLTSPLLITVGLSLAIPMSILGQMVINGQNSSLLYWLGSVVVGISFLIVNQESKREAEETDKAILNAGLEAPAVVASGDEETAGAALAI